MNKFTKIRLLAYTVTGILILGLLIGVGIKNNIDSFEKRQWREMVTVFAENLGQFENKDAPLGIDVKFKLDINDLDNDTLLIFDTSHSFVKVYIDDELVYSMKTDRELTRVNTPGGNWNIIPLYREDSGADCIVVLSPVYESFINQTPSFRIGSVFTVFYSLLTDNFAEIAITVFVMLIGLFFVCFGLYFSVKTKEIMPFFSLGLFACFVSIWRLSDFTITTLVFNDKNVFIYNISLTMLMVSMIPLLEVAKRSFKGNAIKVFDILAFLIGITSIIQLVLQLFGVLDLRMMLSVTHITIVASIVLILIFLIIQLARPIGSRKFNPAFVLILGLGTDLLLFYLRNSSAELILTLLSILIYILIEGVRFVSKYFEQQNKIVENEITIAHNEAKLAESRFTMMMSQIRSHFIFNILNAISGMCKYDPEKADRTIVHFARFLRSNIDIMQNDDLVHFHSALRHLEDYVALEQVRYGDKIQFETDIEEDNFMLPPLVMQPIVENSIKHGLVSKTNGGTIVLRTRKDNDNIYIIIEDDGIGYDDSLIIGEKSIGIQNIKFRLQHMINGNLKIESVVNRGTKSIISLPRREAERCE